VTWRRRGQDWIDQSGNLRADGLPAGVIASVRVPAALEAADEHQFKGGFCACSAGRMVRHAPTDGVFMNPLAAGRKATRPNRALALG